MTGLAGGDAAGGGDEDVEALGVLGQLERLAHDHARGLAAEELVERTLVDGALAGAAAQAHAGGGGLATAGAVILGELHVLDIKALRSRVGWRALDILVYIELLVNRAATTSIRPNA